jgi:hypothetical protein
MGRTAMRAALERAGAGSGPAATLRLQPTVRPRPPPTHPTATMRATHLDQAQPPSNLRGTRPGVAPRILLACPRSSPSPADVATTGRPDDALDRHRAPTPLTVAPSGGRATTRSAGTATVARTSSTPTRHGARNSVPGPRRAGPQGHGGVSVAVPEPSPPEPGSHHNELTEQHLATHRCQ